MRKAEYPDSVAPWNSLVISFDTDTDQWKVVSVHHSWFEFNSGATMHVKDSEAWAEYHLQGISQNF
jgi:hypothetical protein